MVRKYYDVSAGVKINFNTFSSTRGNKYKLQKFKPLYFWKFSYCSQAVNIWNSLPDTINTVDSRLGKEEETKQAC